MNVNCHKKEIGAESRLEKAVQSILKQIYMTKNGPRIFLNLIL